MNKLNLSSKALYRPLAFVVAALGLSMASIGHAQTAPGKSPYETRYLGPMMAQQVQGMRLTELAAGTDLTRDAEFSATEGVAPTPGTQPTLAKAQLEAVRSLARRTNQMLREELLTAHRFFVEWYDVQYIPTYQPDNAARRLEGLAAGPEFDRAFLKVLIAFQQTALAPSVRCMSAMNLEHDALHRYCSSIVHSRTNDIIEMRQLLCTEFGECGPTP